MVSPISNLLPNPEAAAVAAVSEPAPAPRAQPAATPAQQTAQLTEAQQVVLLYNQGQQVAQIASTLSLSVADVNNYLNIPGSSG